jgi:20S proteasome alpha/beta subunit
MTLIVAFACKDGAVIAADSMLTVGMAGVATCHHHGRKVHILPDHHVFAFAGDQGQADRFRAMASRNTSNANAGSHALEYALSLTEDIVAQFNTTGIANHIDVEVVIAYPYGHAMSVCAFTGALQPRLLDQDHFFIALGSGKQMADPFLRFLLDIFSPKQPNVREGVFLATWTLQHTIDTNPGGIAGPIRIVVVEQAANAFSARELSTDEIGEQQQAIADAEGALRDWRSVIAGTKCLTEGAGARGSVPPPTMSPQQ